MRMSSGWDGRLRVVLCHRYSEGPDDCSKICRR